MRSFEEDKQRARYVHSGLVKHGQFMPSQFGAKPTMANTGLDLMMKATALRQAQQQEFQLQQHLRRMEREHKANRFMNAERVMAGKPPILPKPPLSTGPYIGRSRGSHRFPIWQHDRDVTFAIRFIFNHSDGWFSPTGYWHYYNNHNGTLKRIGALGAHSHLQCIKLILSEFSRA